MLSTLIVAQASGPKGQLFCNTDSFIRIIDNIRAMTSCLSIGKTTQPQKATGHSDQKQNILSYFYL